MSFDEVPDVAAISPAVSTCEFIPIGSRSEVDASPMRARYMPDAIVRETESSRSQCAASRHHKCLPLIPILSITP